MMTVVANSILRAALTLLSLVLSVSALLGPNLAL